MKKIFIKLKSFSVIFLVLFISSGTQLAMAASAYNIRTFVEPVEGYQYKTVLKHYKPYSIGIVNDNAEPVYFSSKSQIKYLDANGNEYVFPNNKNVYKKSRKRDVGRYFWVALPGAALGGGIIGITFGLGIIPGLAVAIGGSIPYISAAGYNSKMVNNMYSDNKVPLLLEPKQFYMVYVYLPKSKKDTKNIQFDKICITNLSMKDTKSFDLTIPVDGALK